MWTLVPKVIQKEDAERMKKNWAYMLHSINNMDRKKDVSTIVRKWKAVLDHMFNHHIYCDGEWCYKLQADKLQLEYKTKYDKKNKQDFAIYQQWRLYINTLWLNRFF